MEKFSLKIRAKMDEEISRLIRNLQNIRYIYEGEG